MRPSTILYVAFCSAVCWVIEAMIVYGLVCPYWLPWWAGRAVTAAVLAWGVVTGGRFR